MENQLNIQNNMQEKEYLYWLCQTPLLGAVSIRRLGEFCQSFRNVYYIEEMHLLQAGILKQKQCDSLKQWKKNLAACRREYDHLTLKGIRFVTPLDSDYPQRLRNLYDYPMGLYVKGELPDDDLPAAAIIGARGCTDYGRQIARFMGRELARAGVQIISGLAEGIDGAGHQGALDAKGKTFGVLGCGIQICYPPNHYKLYEAMVQHGGILTELALNQPPMRFHFPMRNRIISGLSDVIIVMEAKEKSGSLITAELGLEQGKEIFALPGRITDVCSRGCNQLIAQGANILSEPEQIAEFLGLGNKKMLRVNENNSRELAKIEKMVYSCLDSSPKALEEITDQTGLSVGICMNALLNLELSGYIIQTPSHYYGKKL